MSGSLDPVKYGGGKDSLDAIARELAGLRRAQADGSDLTRAVERIGPRLDNLVMAPRTSSRRPSSSSGLSFRSASLPSSSPS